MQLTLSNVVSDVIQSATSPMVAFQLYGTMCVGEDIQVLDSLGASLGASMPLSLAPSLGAPRHRLKQPNGNQRQLVL